MTPSQSHPIITEGKAQFQVGSAFYRAQSRLGRDLAILAAAVDRQTRGTLRVLDAMSGSGVRSLRYALEAAADFVWANEGNPELSDLLHHNLAKGLPGDRFQITHRDANEVFFDCYQQRDFYDLVDIDSFGGGAPYLSTGLWATKIGGLLYITSADTRTTGGHNPDRSVQLYGAYARPHPASHEQGTRLLIGSAMQQAAARNLAVRPLFAYYNGHVHRVMLRLMTAVPWPAQQYGFIGYCHQCGHYQTLSWRQLGRAVCDHGAIAPDISPQPLTISGPMWLGDLHDGASLTGMIALANAWHWSEAATVLEIMRSEATLPPYYFTLPEIGRRGCMDIPKRDELMAELRDRGFQVSRTHFDAQAIKTDAAISDCIDAARACQATRIHHRQHNG
ncbi:tRNA (guanine-N1)-methyltransferase [Leptolyngbya iicbica]|uniref:tRNA (Guanine-N1)-methyltransferase n=2 Tax=Cyanophyceae TaxID=3028117 RepID=A0A4Q7EDP9_9CYAN|nr:tRNA (guanine-N1)-methyltransferase [Leptolyngbya sp. LK]RZM79345.1 tRNA (guanine-N1)-methyltransferase [Leptolyngbya sp. LK]